MHKALEIKAGRLYSTPFYIVHADIIKRQVRRLFAAFPPEKKFKLYYAIKANANPWILSILRKEGLCFDACSEGDLYLAHAAGIPNEDISLTGVGFAREQIESFLYRGYLINFDSLQELDAAAQMRPGVRAGIRVLNGVTAGFHEHCQSGPGHGKLGIIPSELGEVRALEKARKVEICTLHTHIGSGISEVEPLIESAAKMFELAKGFPNVSNINLGGGFAAQCTLGSLPFAIEDYGATVLKLKARFEADTKRAIAVSIEPGEYVVAESGSLVMRVRTVKRRTDPVGGVRQVLIMDANLNHFIGTTLYGGEFPMDTDAGGQLCDSVVYGNSNQAGDRFSKHRRLPELSPGSVVIMRNVGAYGFSRSGNFNEHTRPMEVLQENGRFAVIREAEGLEDLGRLIPKGLSWND